MSAGPKFLLQREAYLCNSTQMYAAKILATKISPFLVENREVCMCVGARLNLCWEAQGMEGNGV